MIIVKVNMWKKKQRMLLLQYYWHTRGQIGKGNCAFQGMIQSNGSWTLLNSSFAVKCQARRSLRWDSDHPEKSSARNMKRYNSVFDRAPVNKGSEHVNKAATYYNERITRGLNCLTGNYSMRRPPLLPNNPYEQQYFTYGHGTSSNSSQYMLPLRHDQHTNMVSHMQNQYSNKIWVNPAHQFSDLVQGYSQAEYNHQQRFQFQYSSQHPTYPQMNPNQHSSYPPWNHNQEIPYQHNSGYFWFHLLHIPCQ